MAKNDDLEQAQRAIVDAMTQHATWLHRTSSAHANRVRAEIDKLAKRLGADLADRLDELSAAELSAFAAGRYPTSRLKRLKAEIDGWAQSLDEAVRGGWADAAKELAGYEAEFVGGVMQRALEEMPAVTVSAAALYQSAMDRPIMGHLVDGLLKKVAGDTKERVYARIRQGIAAGEPSREIARALVGTESMKFKDGLLELTRREAETVVRTARGHVANTAYEQTYVELGVEYVRRSAHLEGRTCRVCGALDGKTYAIDEPRPPAVLHPNCRCKYVPAIDEEVMGNRPYVRAMKVKGRDGKSKYRSIGDMTKKQRDEAGLKVGQVHANTTYPQWFASQSPAYQRQWLGPTRHKLWREGKYPLDRFTDPTGREYSIAELRQRDAETFREIFGD